MHLSVTRSLRRLMIGVSILCVTIGAAKADERAEKIAQIETYLNGISSMKASFMQAAADGSLGQGTFYLKRPGRLRWQYDPPTPILIVANNNVLYYKDLELDQLSQVPLRDSFMGLLAKEKLDLKKDVTVDGFEEKSGLIRLTLRQKGREEEGRLILVFKPAPLTLEQLDIQDPTGQRTIITLSDAEYGVALEEKLFTVDTTKPNRRKN